MTSDVGVDPLAVPLSVTDLAVLVAVANWAAPPVPTLDQVCAALPHLPRPDVFAAVARLEDRRLLRWGAVR